MINLYIFNETSPGSVYGIGTYIKELINALKDSNIRICVVHLRSKREDMEIICMDSINHWYIPDSTSTNKSLNKNCQNELYYRNVCYLLKLHINEKNKLIFHLNFMHTRLFAEELRKAFSCKIVHVVHYIGWCFSLFGNNTHFRTLLQRGGNSIKDLVIKRNFIEEKKLCNFVDNVICLSEYTKELLHSIYEINSSKLHVVYNGLSNTIADLNNKNILRKQFLISYDTPVILFVGRLDNAKGLQYLLRAFRIVLETLPKCRLFVVGNGIYDIFFKECEDIWASITFTGRIEKLKLHELYSISDIGVLPSFNEQCSYVAIEMMMHGLPMIASTSTGLCEMIEDGISGLHIPVVEFSDKAEIDISLLAEKMLFLLQNPDERKRMGNNARKRYEKLYSLNVFRKNMLNFYNRLYAPEFGAHSGGGRISVSE